MATLDWNLFLRVSSGVVEFKVVEMEYVIHREAGTMVHLTMGKKTSQGTVCCTLCHS